MYRSLNPFTGELLRSFTLFEDTAVEKTLAAADRARREWAARGVAARAAVVRRAGEVLLARRDEFARLITTEMGKLIGEARAEVEKCARACAFYAERAADFLADEPHPADEARAWVAYQPLGTVFAIMPWNFPFWQVFRFAAPALAAGNTALLKHAPNVPQCAAAIEQVWAEAGAPPGVFANLYLDNDQAARVIGDPRVQAVTLTGSSRAGRAVAAEAGRHLKKCVLELGGSDAFVVLEDADLERAVAQGVKARFQNAGQSCIAAKRFILVEPIAEPFLEAFAAAAAALTPGDPLEESTTLAPLAREDLRDNLHEQVRDALDKGALARTGGAPVQRRGYFYQPTVLEKLGAGMRAWTEELFGPVASIIRVRDEAEALAVANGVDFGLGGSVWTGDPKRGEAFARRLESGAAFVNGMVKSDPRQPFGGIKQSGYGRELGRHGIREFVNAKTLVVAE